MIHDFTFKDTPSKTHFAAITIHQRGSDVPWGTLYQKTYGSNWILERRLSSTESEIINMGTEKKQRAIWNTHELTWDLAKKGLLNPSPQPSLRTGGYGRASPASTTACSDSSSITPLPPSTAEPQDRPCKLWKARTTKGALFDRFHEFAQPLLLALGFAKTQKQKQPPRARDFTREEKRTK